MKDRAERPEVAASRALDMLSDDPIMLLMLPADDQRVFVAELEKAILMDPEKITQAAEGVLRAIDRWPIMRQALLRQDDSELDSAQRVVRLEDHAGAIKKKSGVKRAHARAPKVINRVETLEKLKRILRGEPRE